MFLPFYVKENWWWCVYELKEIGGTIKRTFGAEDGVVFYILRLLKYINQYIKHLDISYPSEVFATLDSYVIFSVTYNDIAIVSDHQPNLDLKVLLKSVKMLPSLFLRVSSEHPVTSRSVNLVN
jgi:hypothetical protein